MELYLLRHGIAEDQQAGRTDADRALTLRGRERLEKVLLQARQGEVQPGLILTSPLRRAIETAEIAARILKPAHVLEVRALEPGGRPEQVWEEVRTHWHEGGILLSGHQPLLSETLAYLLNAPSLRTDFKKGALAALTVEANSPQPRSVLRWLLTAKMAG